MTAHACTWEPAAGLMARYRCACGAWGRRVRGGAIVAMKAPPFFAANPEITARPAVLGGEGVTLTTSSSAFVQPFASNGSRTRRAPRSR